jgi:hypothetical protein
MARKLTAVKDTTHRVATHELSVIEFADYCQMLVRGRTTLRQQHFFPPLPNMTAVVPV